MANASALVIDLQRLQLGFVIYNLYHGLQLELTWIIAQLSKSQSESESRATTFPVHFFLLSFLRVTVGSWISKPPLGAEFL